MINVAVLINIPAPYRVDFFDYISKTSQEYRFTIIYTSRNEDNRFWEIDDSKLNNAIFVSSRVIKIKGAQDDRYVHIPESIAKILSKVNPEIVIASEYNPAALQALGWCRIHKKKFIHLTDGTLYSERNIGRIQRISRRVICSQADACIASSTKAKEKLMAWGVRGEKIFLSLLTVDIAAYQNLKREPIPGRILYVGSMIPRKGLDLLIDALAYVQRDFNVHIVGNGTQEQIEHLRRQIEERNLTEKVCFCGFLQGQDLLEQYQKANVFVLPTREDCFGLVLLEAMCAGVPIVSSQYADGAYDVIDEHNGILADPYDAQQFGAAIDKALSLDYAIDNEKQKEKFLFANTSLGYYSALEYCLKGIK